GHCEDRGGPAGASDVRAAEAGDGDREAGELEEHLRARRELRELPLEERRHTSAVAGVQLEEVIGLLAGVRRSASRHPSKAPHATARRKKLSRPRAVAASSKTCPRRVATSFFSRNASSRAVSSARRERKYPKSAPY